MNEAMAIWSSVGWCYAGDQQHILHVVDQVRGRDHPREPQCGCQRLARRRDERDQVRCEALEGGHRLPAEAVLDVVVVLDDQRPALARPRDQGGTALRRHDDSGRVLVRRRHYHRIDVGGSEIGDDQAVGVHPHGDRLQPGVLDRVPLPAPARIFDRDAAASLLPKHLPEYCQRLGRGTADHDLVGLHDHSAHARQISGDRIPEFGDAAVVRVAQPPVRQLTHRAHQRRLPAGAREGVEIGLSGPQVVPEALWRAYLPPHRRRSGGRHQGDAGTRSAFRCQVTLSGQLRVTIDDHAT